MMESFCENSEQLKTINYFCKILYFVKIVSSSKSLIIFAKSSIMDVRLGSKCASETEMVQSVLLRHLPSEKNFLYFHSVNASFLERPGKTNESDYFMLF